MHRDSPFVPAATSGRPGRATARLIAVAAVAAALVQLVLTRQFLLDDALIHVRAAELLLQAGFPTADGVTRSFADSSPAFLGLTAIGFGLTGSIWVVKALSLVAYGALVALLATRALGEQGRFRQGLLLFYLVLVTSPFGVRWLADGMETGLAVLLAMLLAHRPARRSVAAATLLALAGVGVRMEMLAVVAIVVAADLLEGRLRLALASSAGALLAVLVAYLAFGDVWPDAAVAKARHGYTIPTFVSGLAMVVAGAGVFGIGLLLAWSGLLLSCLLALGRGGVTRAMLADLLGAVSPILVVVAIFARGQAVEGIRPLLPFVVFGLACATRLHGGLFDNFDIRWSRAVTTLIGSAVVVVYAFDVMSFARVAQLQAKSLQIMREMDWSGLRGARGVAWDVGYLAYFSKLDICDAQGLINGPQFAKLSLAERIAHCAATSQFAMVDQSRFAFLEQLLDMTGWRLCAHLDFANRSKAFAVYFLVSPALTADGFCNTTAPRIDRAIGADLGRIAGAGT